MKDSILDKLHHLCDRHEEVGALLSDAEVMNNQNRYRELGKEYAELEPVVQCFARYQAALGDLAAAEEMLEDGDADMREMAQGELKAAQAQRDALEGELQKLLLPKDPNDSKNVFLEIRAGAGGDEAAIFAGDLHRMYSRYADKRGWKVEVISERAGEHGGYREIISRIVGQGVYSQLKFDSGAHRVQRVPETEAQGRIHTSTCTVAILPEADEFEEVNIDKNDLRIDTFRASGAGGQHVNKTDSAIRITHIPTGIVVECQDERSQHKNRSRAMSLLQAKLNDAAISAQQQAEASHRKSLVGTGDRSERIRTYNFPQGRLTDHRINLTLYKLTDIVEGELNDVIQPLINEYQADQLAALAGENR